jgi:hypothetical protein
MNPQYDFIMDHQEQMIVYAEQNQLIRRSRINHKGLQSRVFTSLGDVLISAGTWLKKVSRSNVDKNSVVMYSKN